MLRSDLVATVLIAAAGAAAAADARGPRLSDRELLDALDSQFPGIDAIARLRDRGDADGALAALATFIRQREEPRDFGQRARPSASASASGARSSSLRRAEDVLAHRFVVSGIPHTFGADIDWRFNPTTAPGSTYDRDHEWTWQLNRHSEWLTLANAFQESGDERFAREFATEFADWVADCPVPAPDGPADQLPFSAWRTIEAGIRMSATWPAAFTIFRRSPSLSNAVLISMVKSMIEHGLYLRAHPTSGNWLTMEMNGLYHAGVLLPFAREASEWRGFALAKLLEELDRQVYPDGAQIELTPGYHNVSLRNFLAPVDTARAYQFALPESYVARLERMFAYNLWAMQPDRDLPRWNDSWHVDVRSALVDGFRLFPHRKDFEWVATDGSAGTPPDHLSHFFPYAGQVVFRSGWERDALFLGFEVGPYGYGHQHEDKLGVVVFAYGKALLVEGGSYAYDASEWRAYVLSSRAHNVILVDGHGQNRGGLPRDRYVATAPFDAGFRSGGEIEFARGSYDEGFGPKRATRVRHDREVAFARKEGLFLIRDTLTALDQSPHTYEALFHLDSEDASQPSGGDGIVEGRAADAVSLRIVPAGGEGLHVRVVRAQESPDVQGWLPLGHGIRGVRPIPTVIHARTSQGRSGPVRFLTVLQPLRGEERHRVVRVEAGASGAKLTFAGGCEIELPLFADKPSLPAAR